MSWEKAKDFPSSTSYLKGPSSFLFNNNSSSLKSNDNKYLNNFLENLKELNRENEKKFKFKKENKDTNNNINTSINIVNNFSHNNDSKIIKIDNMDILNSFNQENNFEINKEKPKNIQNQEKTMHRNQNSNLENKTTKETTKEIFNIIHVNSEGESSEGEEIIEEENNNKNNQDYKNRNIPVRFVKNFFKDLVKFINILIRNFNKENNTKIESLKLINGENYIHHNLINRLHLLDVKAEMLYL